MSVIAAMWSQSIPCRNPKRAAEIRTPNRNPFSATSARTAIIVGSCSPWPSLNASIQAGIAIGCKRAIMQQAAGDEEFFRLFRTDRQLLLAFGADTRDREVRQ